MLQFVEVESSKIKKTSDEAKKPQNKAFNRYQDVSPYDETRIILERGNVSYINANLVQVRKILFLNCCFLLPFILSIFCGICLMIDYLLCLD